VEDIFPQLKLKVDAEAKVVNVVEYKYAGALRTPAGEYHSQDFRDIFYYFS
jgi:hypothetical protein